MWTFYISIVFLFVTQIQHAWSNVCPIISMTSTATTMTVTWDLYAGSTVYKLVLDAADNNVAPVITSSPSTDTEKTVFGLLPGTSYEVELTVLNFLGPMCTDTQTAFTVPVAPQFTTSVAVSSTAIDFVWSSVNGAVDYHVVVTDHNNVLINFEETVQGLETQITGLSPKTKYDCIVYASNTAGNSANSFKRTIWTLTQPPSELTVVSSEANSIVVSWPAVDGVLLYKVSLKDTDNPDILPEVDDTSALSKTFSTLEPCSNYEVSVSSLNTFLLAGEPVISTYSTANIVSAANVIHSYSCSDSTVTVSWDAVTGANSYRVAASDGTNPDLECTTVSSLTCDINNLLCGQTYTLTVTAISDDCSSNSVSSFSTMPCTPVFSSLEYTCNSDVVVFSWEPVSDVQYYIAHQKDNNNVESPCMTVDTSCTFTSIQCGQSYTYTVVAYSTFGCQTEASSPQTTDAGPCQPTNFAISSDCLSLLQVSWDLAAGADSYHVEASANNGQTYQCTSETDSCEIANVPCGEHLSMTITSLTDTCNALPLLGSPFQTVPCTPTVVSATSSCSQDTATVSWTNSHGAIFYIAKLASGGVETQNCRAMEDSCLSEGLACGQTYTVTVVATNALCNSSDSDEVTFTQPPCTPTDVVATRDCGTESATIVWQSHQEDSEYTVTIDDELGSLTCNPTSNTDNSCSIESLSCDVTYTVTVTVADDTCTFTSAPASMDSVPCVPQNAGATQNCDTEEVTITWDNAVFPDSYTATITGGASPVMCTSAQSPCIQSGLPCGTSYDVVVASEHTGCFSTDSEPITVETPLCTISNVAASGALSPVTVSWDSTDDLFTYTVTATATDDDHTHVCVGTTTCDITDLHCGTDYTITVDGADCSAEMSGVLSTAPCTPTDVGVSIDCQAESAQLSWTASSTAIEYIGAAETDQGDQLHCTTDVTTCTIDGLTCGTTYSFKVLASDDTYNSSFSEELVKGGALCPPSNVHVQLEMMNWMIQVTGFGWTPVSCSDTEYLLTIVGNKYGNTAQKIELKSYWTDGNYFELMIPCSTTYEATVQSRKGNVVSDPSTAFSGETAPCYPRQAVYTNSGSISVTWSPVQPATTYTVYDNSVTPRVELCSSVAPPCTVSTDNVDNMVITASNDIGESYPRPIQTGTINFIDPFLLIDEVNSGWITLNWTPVDNASEYNLYYRLGDPTAPPTTMLVDCLMKKFYYQSPSTVYCFSVAATLLSGPGPESNMFCVETGPVTIPIAPAE